MVKRGISDGTNNCCLKSVPSKGKRIIILHAGGTDGWASNALLLSAKNIQNCSADYHSDMNSTLFETWFQQQLLPHLPPNSVIVMDNARYHSKLVYKKPSKATKKQEIIDFMITNNINIPDGKITKDTLLQVINNLEIPRQYRVDEIAKSNGHTVLRLPPYYCVLNPIELIWATLKKSIRRKNTSPNISVGVVDLIRNEVGNIKSHLWKSCINHVIAIENSYVSPEFEEFIINLEDTEDSDQNETDYYDDSDR
jgi:transposase